MSTAAIEADRTRRRRVRRWALGRVLSVASMSFPSRPRRDPGHAATTPACTRPCAVGVSVGSPLCAAGATTGTARMAHGTERGPNPGLPTLAGHSMRALPRLRVAEPAVGSMTLEAARQPGGFASRGSAWPVWAGPPGPYWATTPSQSCRAAETVPGPAARGRWHTARMEARPTPDPGRRRRAADRRAPHRLSRTRRVAGRHRRRRARCPGGRPAPRPGPGRAGRHAARARRCRGLPPAPRVLRRLRPDAHGPRRGDRPDHGPDRGGGRLPGEAVLAP